MMKDSKSEELFKRRLTEFAKNAYQRGICLFSDFININEYQLFLSIKNEIGFVKTDLFGGFSEAERRIIAFYPEDYRQDVQFPITCLKIAPLNVKFAENLTHRDYLGAILNLGIERTKLGDILVHDGCTYLFCSDSMASFIMENCTRIRHTTIHIQAVDFEDSGFYQQFEEKSGTVSSVRMDSILSLATNRSRSQCTELIKSEKVTCNHKLVMSNSFTPSKGDLISIRGIGRFRIADEDFKTTKKDKLFIKILKYK